ncbi:MAG: hypothetical protein HY952_03200 [Elusimicrobia bacterium]|nr:hypothetical protein [Elusimicrobiota bacterium]
MTENKAHTIMLTPEERTFRQHLLALYNSGKMREAYDQAKEFYAAHPGTILAKYLYAAMAGDFSDDISLPEEMRTELRETAKSLIKEVYEHKDLPQFEFSSHAKNEYFWFHKLHGQQYQLGEERVAAGEQRGYYSMCVGASAMAKKCLLELNDKNSAAAWAEKSIKAFHEFEKIDPNWHNINYFYAYALTIQGNRPEAIAAYRDMYRKQNNSVNEAELSKFLAEAEQILSRLKE